eukprot:PhM_4_TR3422/c0_g1_i1/m.411/K04461/PPM1B, PP2CB; protein phosphatase 1B
MSFLDEPVKTMCTETYTGSGAIVGVSVTVGGRGTMEDAHCVKQTAPNCNIVGVFDGHEVPACAEWLSKNLPSYIPVPFPTELEVLKQKFEEADEAYRMSKQTVHGGSTCAMLSTEFIPEDKSYKIGFAHVGDSRVIHGREGTLLHVTTDHKPDTRKEGTRIRRRGSSVFDSRVDGMLAMSRAFGDYEWKKGQSSDKFVVISEPELHNTVAQPGDFIIVACDGLFEGGLTDAQVCQAAYSSLRATRFDPTATASHLVKMAVNGDSWDNISVSVVYLDGVQRSTMTQTGKGLVVAPYPVQMAHDHTYYFALSSFLKKCGNLSMAQYFEAWYDAATSHGASDTDKAFVRAFFGEATPPKELTRSTPQRLEWFQAFMERKMS